MNVIVCVKQVPEVADADLEVDAATGRLEIEDLVFDINEWDSYAMEEAVRLKEVHGGHVTAVTIGDEEGEEVLRRCLAMGADDAVRVDGTAFAGSDAMGVARGLQSAIAALPFDLVLTGVQSSDDGWGQVGVALAELLDLPCASLVVAVEIEEGRAVVHRELESNVLEKVELPVPALLTVQTGINSPRYVSIMGIRRVRDLAIRQVSAEGLGLAGERIGMEGSGIASSRLAAPERTRGAEILTGSVEDVCERAARIILERGGS